MKLEKFYIAYNNRMGIFNSGETLTGNVVLQFFGKELKFNDIYLRCTGMATVKWQETVTSSGADGSTTTTTYTYTDVESYFEYRIQLIEPVPGTSKTKVIAPGIHTFPFEIILPKNLPPSFEGTFGHIRYLCKCTITRPWRFDHSTKQPFTMLSVADLNTIPNINAPVTITNAKKVGLFMRSGPLTSNITLSKSGFVPGEFILINATIDNASKTYVVRSTVTLYSNTEFIVKKRKKEERKVLCQLHKGKISKTSTGQWINDTIRVPPLPPTGLGGCSIIKTNYFLKFTVEPDSVFTRNLKIVIPVTIGTIPLISDFSLIEPSLPQWLSYESAQGAAESGLANCSSLQQWPNKNDPAPPYQQYQSVSKTMEPAPPYELPCPQSYPNMPPPSYEETVYGRSNIQEADDDEHTMGQMDFAPRYAYFQYHQASAINQPRV